jgi:hypothetical protein
MAEGGDDDRDQPKQTLKVVSDNPNVDKTRPIKFAKDEAERTLAVAAATMLRTIAGSDGAAAELRRHMVEAILAEEKYYALAGQWLASWERQKALALSEPKFDNSSDFRYREYERECGMQNIVQGSLRLAAHQVLDERPHFGGKYSEDLIQRGMDAIKRANGPPPPPLKPPTKKQGVTTAAAQRALLANLKNTQKQRNPESPRKRWSPLDSKSYRDIEPKE